MTMDRNTPLHVDRRTTIKWVAATMIATNTGCGSNTKFLGDEIPASPNADKSLLGIAAAPNNVRYGTDPDLINPVVPWSRTMTDAQLRTAATTCDMILPADDQSPAASAVGVPDFIDEWVSAPYEEQQHDRKLIFEGLEWLEQQSQSRFGTAFSSANSDQAAELLNNVAYPDKAAAGDDRLFEFFSRFRHLTVGAFYTTKAGMTDIGYIGNVPISGDYPGPSAEAMRHLAGVLDTLGLSLPS